jgi:hypothetical protein
MTFTPSHRYSPGMGFAPYAPLVRQPHRLHHRQIALTEMESRRGSIEQGRSLDLQEPRAFIVHACGPDFAAARGEGAGRRHRCGRPAYDVMLHVVDDPREGTGLTPSDSPERTTLLRGLGPVLRCRHCAARRP